MTWLRLHKRSAVFIGLTLLLPVFFYIKTVFGLLGLGFEYSAERASIEPRVARMQGLLDFESELRDQSEVASNRLRKVVFPAEEEASALAAALQADVRQLLVESGLSVSNSQVMPLRQGADFDRVAVKLTVAGSLNALDAALIAIAAYQPELLVESLDVFPARSRNRRKGAPEEQRLTAVLQLMVLREVL
ncbi:MAG: type II secretion system protein GspM [Congregibacter sp.]